jgi:uncharacterized protein YdaL
MKEKQVILDKIREIQSEDEPDEVCALNGIIWKHIHHEKLNVLKEILNEAETVEKSLSSEQQAAEIMLEQYLGKSDLKTLIDELPHEKLADTAHNLERILKYIETRQTTSTV